MSTTETKPDAPEIPESDRKQRRDAPHFSPELAAEIDRIATEQRSEADRKKQEELARLREIARFD